MDQSVKADVRMHERKCDLYYENVQMLSASVYYPEVLLAGNETAQERINRRIRAQVETFSQYASGELYRQAVQEFLDSQEHDFPFRMFGAELDYTVVYHQNCHFSLSRDRYQYTGGAHGMTERLSDTWSIETGRTLPLSRFFRPGEPYGRTVLAEVMRQADRNMQQTPGIYFDDYRRLILQSFNPEHYYLTPEGAAVYFQQYEIAPYASGIIVFVVPYGMEPACR